MKRKTAKAVLMAQDLSGVLNIVLTHLSERNSDEILFADQISVLTGKPVKVAQGGLTINPSRHLF